MPLHLEITTFAILYILCWQTKPVAACIPLNVTNSVSSCIALHKILRAVYVSLSYAERYILKNQAQTDQHINFWNSIEICIQKKSN